MQRFLASVVGVALLVAGCDGGAATPVAPSQVLSGPAVSPFPFAERYTPINIGDVITGRVAADDLLCVSEPLWPCQYFQFTPSRDGRLEVVMTHSTGNLDVSVTSDDGASWWDPRPVPGTVRVSGLVKAGATYQIVVWEYESPGVEFTLRTSLAPV